MPLITTGRTNPDKFNALTMAALLLKQGIIPAAVPAEVAVDMGQSLVDAMISSGVVETKC